MASSSLSGLNRLSTTRKTMVAVFVCAATTLLATPLRHILDPANIVMLFLMMVLLVAAGLGRSAGVLSAFLSVLLFDVFFVPPRFSLAVQDAQYLVTFVVMLATALVTAHLAAGLRRQAELAAASEAQTRALYEMARELAGALTVDQVTEIVRRFLKSTTAADGAILLPDESGKLVPEAVRKTTAGIDPFMVGLAYDNDLVVDARQVGSPDASGACFPLRGPARIRGVLAVCPLDANGAINQEQRQLIETAASLIAIALERLHYVEIAQRTQLAMAAERLRSSVLSALSHDLRTPLTVLVGLADSLAQSKPPLPADALDEVLALRAQAVRLACLVGNLLDMARLQSGQVTLRKEWQPIEEVIGSAIKLLGAALDGHPVHVVLAPDLPLLELDAVLMERVLFNLLDNAVKFSPAGAPIDIAARCADDRVAVEVCDRGCGFPADKARLFGMFVRGETPTPMPGVGLGLAICRAIIDVHQGSIEVIDRDGGGTCVRILLTIGQPPMVEEEADAVTGEDVL